MDDLLQKLLQLGRIDVKSNPIFVKLVILVINGPNDAFLNSVDGNLNFNVWESKLM